MKDKWICSECGWIGPFEELVWDSEDNDAGDWWDYECCPRCYEQNMSENKYSKRFVSVDEYDDGNE